MSAEARLAELDVELPTAPKPGGTYNPIVKTGNIAYISGHGPLLPDGSMITGKIGDELTTDQGNIAARQVGLTILATVKAQLGSIDKIKRFIKVLGMVNATSEFGHHPQVINGFSDLMVDLYGDNGRAARSAVGMGSLPGNISVEIEAIVELAD